MRSLNDQKPERTGKSWTEPVVNQSKLSCFFIETIICDFVIWAESSMDESENKNLHLTWLKDFF